MASDESVSSLVGKSGIVTISCMHEILLAIHRLGVYNGASGG